MDAFAVELDDDQPRRPGRVVRHAGAPNRARRRGRYPAPPLVRWCLPVVFALVAAVPAQLQVMVAGVPDDLVLPVPAGRTVAIVASVSGGETENVWLARARDATAKVPLLSVGEGRFRMNLADPRVADVLREQGDAVAIFARANDGTVARSAALPYAPQTDAPRPRLVVHEHDRVRRLEWAAPGWAEPTGVSQIELDLPEAPGARAPFARLGPDKLQFVTNPGAPTRLEVTAAIAAAWREYGELEIGADAQQGAVSFRLRAFPERPQGKGTMPLSFKVDERMTAPIPGTNGAVHVSVGEVRAFGAEQRLHTAEGVTVFESDGGQVGRIAFTSESGPAVLMVDTTTISFVGQDSVTFHVEMLTADERAMIERALALVAASPLLFWRHTGADIQFLPEGGVRFLPRDPGRALSGAAFARLMRDRTGSGDAWILSVEEFMDRTVIAPWDADALKKGPDYVRLADGTEVEVAGWLREQVATLRAPGQAEARK